MCARVLRSYGLDLFLLSIDEGISGYRDDSLETVKRNEVTYGIPLLVVSSGEMCCDIVVCVCVRVCMHVCVCVPSCILFTEIKKGARILCASPPSLNFTHQKDNQGLEPSSFSHASVRKHAFHDHTGQPKHVHLLLCTLTSR